MNQKGGGSFALVILGLFIVLLVLLGVRTDVFKKIRKVTGFFPVPITTSTPNTLTPTTLPVPAETKSDQYGVNTGILVTEEPYFDSALDYAASTGVAWIRISNDWMDLEPIDNQWDFSESDKYVDAASSKDLKILYMFDPDLNGSFCSVAPGKRLREILRPTLPRCTDEQFKDYITQIVTRYKGKVAYYELGNEPDLRGTWKDYPAEYAQALAVAYPTLKAADPNAKLLIGGLAMGGGQNSDLQYLDKLIAAGALNNFDIFNYHTYETKEGILKQFNELKPKIGNKPIWLTEVGFPSDPNHQQEYRSWYKYPSGEDGQAQYLQDILPYILSLGIEKVFWYTLMDVPRDNSAFCSYGLLYIPGKQCMGGGEANRKIGGELRTKKAADAYQQAVSDTEKLRL